MKKLWLIVLGVCASGALSAAQEFRPAQNGVDGKLFLDPHVDSLAAKTAAVSVNVGCHIPSTTHIVSNDSARVVGLGAHFRDLADRLAEGGAAVVAAPASYGVLFTTGDRSEEEVLNQIETVLGAIGTSDNPETIAHYLGQLTDVTRATFVRRGDTLRLVRNEKDLRIGEAVWRKTPNGAEIQVYHSEEEYLVALANAGLTVEEIKRPCFFGEVKWKAHNKVAQAAEHLGPAYKDHHPFTIYNVKKG